MCADDGRGVETPAREGDLTVNTDTKPANVNESDERVAASAGPPSNEPAAPAKKKAVAAKPKAAVTSQTKKTARRPPRSPRAASRAEKLVCRYCGSDDLAPSFKKRRDARCRACFKKRYGSARGKQAKRIRKAKAAK
jgi:hypothetical protein